MADENEGKETQTNEETSKETKPRNDYKNQIAEFQRKYAETEQRLAETTARLQQIEEEKLQSQNNYKTLWETEKQKREEAEGKAKQIQTSYVNGLKMSAIKEQALKLGIVEQAVDDLGLLDTSMVQTEFTTSGNVNIIGAQEFVEHIKNQRPFWFKGNTPPTVNNQAGNSAPPKDLSAHEILKMQKENPDAYAAYMKTYLQKR
jgi:hypothetical protein